MKGGQSGTAESWREQNALTSELRIRRWIDEHIDGAVGVRQPHRCELHCGRRLERADESLRERYDAVRRPEHEVSDAGKREDLQSPTTTDSVGSPNCRLNGWLLTFYAGRTLWRISMKSDLDTLTLKCRSYAQSSEDKNCSMYRWR